MSNSPILNIPQVAASQNQKEATINTGVAILEAALNDDITISLASGNVSLTTDQFTKYFHQIYAGHTVARNVTIPNTPRFFAASNTGTANITIKCTGSAGAQLVVASGKRVLVLSDGTDVVAITSGVTVLANLTDVVGADSASSGQLLGYDGANWTPVYNPAPQGFFQAGTPSASQKLLRHIFVANTLFYSDFSQSFAVADVAATAETVFNVYKNATLVGTITFAVSGTTGTLSTDTGSGSSTVSFAPGDTMTIVAPASPDSTLADISVTLLGIYS